MKVKELGFISIKNIKKIGADAEMEVDDYLKLLEDRQKQGIKMSSCEKELYYDILNDRYHQFQGNTLDVVNAILEQIPIEDLKYTFHSDAKLIDKLQSGGIETVGQFFCTSYQDLKGLRSIGETALYKTLLMKESLSKNPHVYYDAWRDSLKIHELPSNYNRSFGLQNNLRNAIVEYAQIIESNLNNHRYIENSQQYNSYALIASILKKFYYEKQTIDSIAQKEACTHEYVDIVKNNCLSDIISGNTLFKNYRLNRDLLDLIQSLKSECLFESIHTFEVYSGSKDTSFLKDLGLDFLAIKDVIILIPKYTKLFYNTVWKRIYYTLLENPLPTNREVIYQLVIDNDDLSDVEFDPLFVEKVLACDKIVDERDNNTIQIKDEYLTNSAQRCARIVFEAGQKLTTEELINRYESIYQKKPNIIYRKVHEYGINCEGKRYWYFGQPKTSLQQRISEYAEKNGIFFYCELEQALKDEGYTIPPTIRTYITNVCAVDNKDVDHFCFKDYVDEYQDYSWRNPTKYGWANWVFNEIRCILLERGTVPYREMIDELENRSHTTEYIKIRHRLQYNMSYFCGEDKPFVIVDGNVVINQPIYDKTEFETIGLRGGKYAYYKQIRSLVANEVKKAESGKMRLTDVINLVNETVVDDEPLNRGVIIRAIEDKQNRFAPIDVEIVSEGGGLYIQWTKQDINPDPVYVVSSTDDSTEDDYVVEAEEQTDNRPNISYRQVVDWLELTRILKRELSFCKGWLLHEGYDLNTAIDSFIRLIKQSNNPNLNSRLPQDLYEYWFARTDGNDRYRYLTDLLLFFEGVLAEIYYFNHNSKPPTHGLGEMAGHFVGLPTLMLYSRDNRGFSRIVCNLQYNRNKVAHGEYLELSTSETAKAIVEYVALFVYVVARYCHKDNL